MDIYAIVTDKIINLLEQGVVPWRRPWTATGLPRPPNPARQRMVRDARGSGGSGESAIVIAEKRFGP